MKELIAEYRHSIWAKLGVLAASLFLCLAAAEIGLRLTGFAWESSRRREFLPEEAPFDERVYHVDETFERYRPEHGRERLILTLGDSLTNGGNVKSYHSYPYYLYENFARAGLRAGVFNMGYCEDSTFGVALKFKNYLESHPKEKMPDAAVILVGAADLFNLPLIRERKLKDDTFWYDVLPSGWLHDLRLYKVYRHIKLSWMVRPPAGGGPTAKSNEERLDILLKAYERHKEEMEGDERRPLSEELAGGLEAEFAEDVRQADYDLEIPGDFTDLLSDYGARVYQPRHRYDDFFALLLDVARTFPSDFWNDYFTSVNYHFVQMYQVQSRFTAAEVLKVLEASRAGHPDLANNENFRHFRKILLDRDEMDRFVDRKRMETWDEMVRLAKEHGIQIVLQNYPVQYVGANRVLDAVAEKHGLPLIDNRKFFGDLIAREGRAKYMEDDDHLKPAGNRLMAKNVYDAVMSSVFNAGR